MTRCFRSTAILTISLAAASLFASPTLRGQAAPGPIQLLVDATEAPRQILHAREVIPVKPGPITLLYAKWIPGEHMPDGPITDLAGLKISAHGAPIAWRRDLLNMFAFHLDVPAGTDSIDVQLDYLLTGPGQKFSAGASATSQLTLVSWNQVLLYPQGWPANELMFAPSLRIPQSWQFGTALPVEQRAGTTIEFKPAPLNTLIDSPVLAGAHVRVISLTPGENPTHEIDLAADSEAALAMSTADIEHYKHLVAETGALFGSRHYRDYHFLFTLSDDVAHFGLEHHESSDDRVAERTVLDDDLKLTSASLLPHEFTHSWNGKFRRPADLLSPDYQQPMKGDLMWVYEGLTEYIGNILTARSGLWTPEQFREYTARTAGYLDHRPGREWRSLQDTADAAQLLYTAPDQWEAWRRSTDYYDEGFLVWLDVDTTIRRETHGQKSLNDFCRIFHGGPGGSPETKPYTFGDIVSTLNQVAPYDWAAFLNERLNYRGPHAPVGGLENGGWRVIYNETPNTYDTANEHARKIVDLTYSIGLVTDEEGTVRDVLPGMSAYADGLGPGMRIEAVNGRQWSDEILREAVRDSKSTTSAMTLLVANGDYYSTVALNYHGGLLYPHLEKLTSRPDLLSEIIQPLAARK
jgi:predicted metalloprotease with PDZ domain